jgi:predicted transcriptional regulator
LEITKEISPTVLSKIFLELASEQRMSILFKLFEKNYKISSMAKELSATNPEIHRNFQRLINSGLISKTGDGSYELTFFGKVICLQSPLFQGITKQKKFFQTHSAGILPEKFILRLGILSDAQFINGYVKVMEKWNDIYQNTEEYINNILVEVSYSANLMQKLLSKLEQGIKIYSIFSEGAIITKERKELIKNKKINEFIKNESLNRKMEKDLNLVLVMNEKEAGISFPYPDGTHDLSHIFYSKEAKFHDWCEDYFKFLWLNSKTFKEEKLVQ